MTTENHDEKLKREVASRRTFAIISHPDAGQDHAHREAAALRRRDPPGGLGQAEPRRTPRSRPATGWSSSGSAASRSRPACCSSSTAGASINLLDTPGHNDFCEDTYRTLAAADAAVMLIDSVKGVEPQTIKLFQVCRMRGIPIFTFINKLDRGGKEPLDLLDEIERVLGIPCSPVNWPIGSGTSFYGVYDRWRKQVLHFERAEGGARRAPMTEGALDDEELREALGAHAPPPAAPTSWRCWRPPATRSTLERLPARRRDAGLLRQRHDQLRRRAVPGPLRRRWRRAPRPRTTSTGALAPDDPRVLGVRVQDPGEHGSQPPRPHRVRAHLLGAVHARHGGAPRRAPARR